jgi:flagellar biosynthesis/type III secretory pathway chaperone
MSNFEKHVRELLTLLETENARISSGDFTDIKEIAEGKVVALRALEPWLKKGSLTRDDARALHRLKTLGVQNGILLKAVMNGVRYAQARLDRLQSAESSLGAYDRTGQGMYIDGEGIKNTIIM